MKTTRRGLFGWLAAALAATPLAALSKAKLGDLTYAKIPLTEEDLEIPESWRDELKEGGRQLANVVDDEIYRRYAHRMAADYDRFRGQPASPSGPIYITRSDASDPVKYRMAKERAFGRDAELVILDDNMVYTGPPKHADMGYVQVRVHDVYPGERVDVMGRNKTQRFDVPKGRRHSPDRVVVFRGFARPGETVQVIVYPSLKDSQEGGHIYSYTAEVMEDGCDVYVEREDEL
jgi:hypothetical protein